MSEYCRDFVCTVVLGDDIITRQGMLMMDDLKMQILDAIKDCQVPKVMTHKTTDKSQENVNQTFSVVKILG